MEITEKKKLYDLCTDLREEGQSWVAVHKEVKKQGLITKYVDVNSLINIYRDIAGQIAAQGMIDEVLFDKNVVDFFKFIGKTRPNIRPDRVREPKKDGEEITIIISDVHIPYEDAAKLQKAIDHGKEIGATRLVIAGDFLNGDSLSSHPHLVLSDLQKECIKARTYLEVWSADFDEVVIVDDNHVDSRLTRYKAQNLAPDVQFLLQHPYDLLCAGLPNVKRASSVNELGPAAEEFKKEFGWFYKLGDAVFTHAEKHSANEFKMLRDIRDWLVKWEPVLQLGKIRLVGQAHNHNVGYLHEADCMLLFTGCMVGLGGLTYSMSAKCAGKPPIHGYVVLVQENGVTNLEKTYVQRITGY